MKNMKINLIASVGNMDEIEAQIESLQNKLNSLKVEIKVDEHDEISTNKTLEEKVEELESDLPRASVLLDNYKPSDHVLDRIIPTIIEEINSGSLCVEHSAERITDGDRLYIRNFFQRNGYKVKFTTRMGTYVDIDFDYVEVSAI